MTSGPEAMRAARKALHLSQEELARLSGLSMPAVSAIERGVNQPRRDTAKAIDAALGADGEVMASFGFGGIDELNQLRAQVVELDEEMEVLSKAVLRLLEFADQLPDADELTHAVQFARSSDSEHRRAQ